MSPQPTMRDQLERWMTLLRRSRRYMVRGIVVAVAIIAFGIPYTLRMPRTYTSETLILYRETVGTNAVAGVEVGMNDVRRLGSRLKEMLNSRARLEPVINEFHLYPAVMERRGIVDAVEEMRQHIQFRAHDGDTYSVSFDAQDPVLAQKVAQRLGDFIVEEATLRRSAQARLLQDFLDTESQHSTADLKLKEAAMAQFLAAHPVFLPRVTPVAAMPAAPSFRQDPGLNAPSSKSSDPQLAALEARAARIEKRLRPVGTGAGTTSPRKPVLAPENYPEVVEARRDLADKVTRYTDRHPDVVAARARLKQVEEAALARAQREADRDRDPAPDSGPALDDAQRAALRSELADVRSQMEVRKKAMQAAGVPIFDAADAKVELEVEFRKLQREVERARDRQKQLDDRLFRARLAANSVDDDRNIQVSILDPAFKPTHPSKGGRGVMLLGFGFFALFAGLAVSVGSALIDDRIYNHQELSLLGVAPVLAVIPEESTHGK